MDERRRKSDGVPYVVYKLSESNREAISALKNDRISSAIAAMQANTATVLELAATAHWLAVYEKKKDWEQELRKRKGVKLDSGREKQALELLKSLKLQPAI